MIINFSDDFLLVTRENWLRKYALVFIPHSMTRYLMFNAQWKTGQKLAASRSVLSYGLRSKKVRLESFFNITMETRDDLQEEKRGAP